MKRSDPHPSSVVTPEDLSLALQICRKAKGHLSREWPWMAYVWLEVVDSFGQNKADRMFEELEKMRAAFFSIPSDPRGKSVVAEAMEVSNAFQAQFPDAPVEVIDLFKGKFMLWNR